MPGKHTCHHNVLLYRVISRYIAKLQLTLYPNFSASLALSVLADFQKCQKKIADTYRHGAYTHFATKKWRTKWRRRFEMAAGQRCQTSFQGALFKCRTSAALSGFADQKFGLNFAIHLRGQTFELHCLQRWVIQKFLACLKKFVG